MESQNPKPTTDKPTQTVKPQPFKDNASPNLKKQRQRTTNVALGVLMIVALGLIGFEVITSQVSKVNNEIVQKGSNKSLLIVSKDNDWEETGLKSGHATDWNDTDVGEIVAIKETNRLQTSRIKELKRKIVEADHKLHEMKSQLFTKGDPAERARLAEICQALAEEKHTNEDLLDRIAVLEIENLTSEQKFARMESIIEALAAMTETQRTTKEQAIFSLQAKIDQIQEEAREEREEFTQEFEEYGKAQDELRESISSGLNNQLQDLATALEVEILKSNSFQDDLQSLKEEQSGLQDYSQSLETLLRQIEKQAEGDRSQYSTYLQALTKEYVNLQGLTDVYTATLNVLEKTQQELSDQYSEERTRAEKLLLDLDIALSKIDTGQQHSLYLEDVLNDATKEVTSLKETLEENSEILALFQDTIADKKDFIQDLESRIDDLTTELERERVENEEDHQTFVEDTSNKLNALESAITEKQDAIQTLHETITQITGALESEQFRAKDLGDSLSAARTDTDFQIEATKELEKEILENSEEITFLKETIRTQQEEVSDFANNVSLERNRSLALQQTHEKEKQRNEELESTVQEYSQEIESLKETLTSKNNEVNELHDRIYLLGNDFEHESAKAVALNEKLESGTKEVEFNREQTSTYKRKYEELEKKHAEQLDLMVKQQEIIGKLSSRKGSQETKTTSDSH
ncbi:MAG: Chromosome partition protein Smc [Chlamydiae bacterium]|nr:Chromosome partition protein Smc [Chlamydiota bacterium]